MTFMQYRVQSTISDAELQSKRGKVLTEEDYNVLITRPARVMQPDGKPLLVYLPGVLRDVFAQTYPVLTTIRSKTDNRGLASGSARVKAGTTRTRSMPIMSSILGAMDPVGPMRFCRLTAWTGKETEQWESLRPLWQAIGEQFEEHVPHRFAKQMEYTKHTCPDWVIPGTPFTTVTINNSYSTGVHTDSGDLDAGFSCLAATRRGGDFTGGTLVFPEYRVGVDMRDGDLLLMDAHQWHGNTRMFCGCLDNEAEPNDAGELPNRAMVAKPCEDCGAERISVVCYYRTEMHKCATLADETTKRLAYAEQRAARGATTTELEAEAEQEDALAVVTSG